MKKKIICIGILSMILLTGLTTVSGTKIETSDFTIDEDKISPPEGPVTGKWSFAWIAGEFNIDSVTYERIGNTNLLKNVVIEGYAEVYPQPYLNFNIGLFIKKYYKSTPHLNLNVKMLINPPELGEGSLVNFGNPTPLFGGTIGIGITVTVLD